MSLRLCTIVAFMIATVSRGVFAESSYFCTADLVAGFYYDQPTKQWQRAEFNATNKYLITRGSQAGHVWDIKLVGSPNPIISCDLDFADNGNLRCRWMGGEFLFNRLSMRYLSVYVVGYWNEGLLREAIPDRAEGGDSPHIEIGKCTSL